MKKEKLIGTTTITYKDNCSVQVLNIKETLDTKHKKEEHYYSDFYNVCKDGVYFIDRIELEPFCENLGYQLINGKLVIYSYNIVVGRRCHAVKKIFKYYDVEDNININFATNEIIDELGFNLSDEYKNKLELVNTRLRKIDEYIKNLEQDEDFTEITPIINICGNEKFYTNKRPYSAKMLSPIPRDKFACYYTKLVTGSDKNIIVNKHVIKIDDYKKNEMNSKIKNLKK